LFCLHKLNTYYIYSTLSLIKCVHLILKHCKMLKEGEKFNFPFSKSPLNSIIYHVFVTILFITIFFSSWYLIVKITYKIQKCPEQYKLPVYVRFNSIFVFVLFVVLVTDYNMPQSYTASLIKTCRNSCKNLKHFLNLS